MPTSRQPCAVLLLVLFALAVSLNSTRNGFVWDDAVLVQEKRGAPTSTAAGVLLGYWSQHAGASTPGYYPARELSLALDRKLWGAQPWGFHLTNVALHVAAAVLVFAAARRITGKQGLALIAALIWCVHPATVECVSWIKNRSILLCATASFAALALFTAGRGPRTRVAAAIAAAVLLGVGLLCKEMAAVVPLIAAAVVVMAPRLGLRQQRWPLAALWAVLVLYLGLKAAAFTQTRELAKPLRREEKPGLVSRVAQTYAAYAAIAAAPITLCPDRRLNSPTHPGIAGLFAACMALAYLAGARRWLMALGLLWFMVGLGPASNLIYLGDRPLAEQRMYLALPGLALMFAAIRWRRRRWLLAACVLALCALSMQRHAAWAGNYALWTRTVPQIPGQARPWLNMGNHYLATLRPRASEHCERQAAKRDPTWYAPWLQIGRARYDLGQTEQAAQAYVKALSLAERPELHYELADCYAKLGRLDDALNQCAAALALDGTFAAAYVRMALILMDRGDAAKAEEVLRTALRRKPDAEWPRFELGNVLFSQGRHDEALAQYDAILRSGHPFAKLHVNRGKLLMRMKRPADAEAAFRAALDQDASQWEAWSGLGTVAEMAGQLPAAANYYRRALALNPNASIARRRLSALQRRAPKQ